MSRPLRWALLLLVCGIAFWWRLGYLGLIDPDEPFYAQTTREMLRANDWVTPRIFDHPQFEKPIAIYWLTMASFRAFGATEFAARFPMALFATLLVFLTYGFASRVLGRRTGLLAAIVLATSVEVIVSARMVLTDMVFAAFVCGSAFALWLAAAEERLRERWFLAACALSGLAVLTKGPLGLLLPALALAALLVMRRSPLPARPAPILAGAALFAVIAVPWYAIMLRMYGRLYYDSFFIHENVSRFFHAEHPSNNRVWFYPGILIGGSIPWMPLLGVLALRARSAAVWSAVPRWLGAWSLLCLVFFTMAASKLPSYVLFLFVPLAILLAHALETLLREGTRSAAERWTMGALGLAQAAAFLVAPRLTSYAALAMPLALVGGCLLVALLLQVRRVSTPWAVASAATAPVLVLACLGWAGPTVDDILSIRALARTVTADATPSRPVITSPILARGVTYYSDRPVAVLSTRPQPWYTPHPLPVVLGAEGLSRYVDAQGPSLCVLTAGDWSRYHSKLPGDAWSVEESRGDKVVARVSAAGGSPAGGSPAGGSPALPESAR